MQKILIAGVALFVCAALAYAYHTFTVITLGEKARLAEQQAAAAKASAASAKATQRAEDSLERARTGSTDAREDLARRIREAKQ